MQAVGSLSPRVILPLIAAALLGGCGSQEGSTRQETSTTGTPQAGVAPVALTIPSGNAGGALHSGLHLRLPQGWRAEVWARVPDARLEAWTPQGDLLVSEPGHGQVMELLPRQDRAEPPAQRVLVSGLDQPQGLAFADLSGREVLYVAEASEVDRYEWLGDRVGARRIVVSNLPHTAPPGSDDHTYKNVVVGADDRIYVDIGGGSNASPPTPSNPPRASVVSYTANGTDMRLIATGVRNGDGLSFAPDGTLWTAV